MADDSIVVEMFHQLGTTPGGSVGKGKGKAVVPSPEAINKEPCATKKEESCSRPPSFWRLVSLSKPEWGALSRAVFVAILCICVDSLTPDVKRIMDDLLIHPELTENNIYGILFFQLSGDTEYELRRFTFITIVLRSISFLLGIMKGITFGLVSERVVARMRLKLFTAMLSQDMGFFDSRTSGELASRLGPDAQMVQFIAAQSIPDATLYIIKVVVLTTMMFAQSWELSLALLGLIPCIFTYCLLFLPLIIKLNTMYQDAVARSSDVATQGISNLKVVRAFGAEGFMHKLYGIAVGDISSGWWPKRVKNIYRVGVFKAVTQQLMIQGTIAIGITGFTAISWWSYDMIINNKITYGTGGAFTTYAMMVIFNVGLLVKTLYAIGPAKGASQRIFEIIDREPVIKSNGGETLAKVMGDVTFENVSFAYPTRPDIQILSNVSFSIPAKAKAAFVGGSGAGKSTVLMLLERLYDVTSGRVLVDGHDIRTLNAQWLRRRIGVVQQEPVLFGFSIRENILFGRRAASVTEGCVAVTEEDIFEAAKKANAHEFISSFPEGYDTLVGERGIRLSGGQKQRIAIARTILCDPSMMLLDEATSALDSESEFVVQEALDWMMKDRTVLVVAHRLSTVIDADKIFVMSKEGIVSQGKHDELLKSCDTYKELVKHQLNEPTKSVANAVVVESRAEPVQDKSEILLAPQTSQARVRVDAAEVLTDKSLEEIVLQNDRDVVEKKKKQADAAAGKKSAGPPKAPCGFLLKLIRPELFVLIGALLFTLSSTAIEAYLPMLQAEVVDYIVGSYAYDTKIQETVRLMKVVIILNVAVQIIHYIRVAVSGVAAERVVARLRLWTFHAIFKQDMAFFDSQTTGDLTSRLTSDAQLVQVVAQSSFIEFVINFVKIVVSLIMTFNVSWQLSLMIIGIFVSMGVVLLPCLLPFFTWIRKHQEAIGRATNVSTEATGSMRTVISFGSEQYVTMLYTATVGRLDGSSTICWWPRRSFNSSYRYGVLQSVGFRIIGQAAMWIGGVLLSLISWYAYVMILNAELTFGKLYAFFAYAFAIMQGAAGVAGAAGGVVAAMAALGRVYEIWNREPEFSISGGKKPEALTMQVDFEDVSFAYPARPDVKVMQNISFSIPANSTAAFVGASGSGKSTVLQLLARFYDVEKGTVRLGGHDIRDLDAGWMRRRIGVVQQEPILFGFDVRSNIAYGRNAMHVIEGIPPSTEDEIKGAAEIANAHGFISQFPEGYQTLVGERGVLLSGGQKQRIAIARALLMEPKLLLLDEATSALDAESEHLVQEAIDQAMQNRTVLVVAHRLSTVRNASQIFVMDAGRIADVGMHADLMDRCERYQELVKRQEGAAKRNNGIALEGACEDV